MVDKIDLKREKMGDALSNAIANWLASDREKPLLVHGDLQSGKKTTIRRILTEKEYSVWEPTTTDLDFHYDVGYMGFHAYIMRMDEGIGISTLPNVKKAPVIYVCSNPYAFGLSKPELEKRFKVVGTKTGKDFSITTNKTRDRVLNHWEALDGIKGMTHPQGKLLIAESAEDRFRCVIQDSYLTNPDLEAAVKTSELLSWTDAYVESRETFGHHIPEYSSFLTVVTPIGQSQISKLVVSKADIEQFYKKNKAKKDFVAHPLLTYETIHCIKRKVPKEQKKATKTARKRKSPATRKEGGPKKTVRKCQ